MDVNNSIMIFYNDIPYALLADDGNKWNEYAEL